MNRRNLVLILGLVASLTITPARGMAQGPPPAEVRYTLLTGSEFLHDCGWCGAPPLDLSMTGTFTLRVLDSSDPLVTRYQLTNIFFAAEGHATDRLLTGEGTYQVEGKEVLLQDVSLALQVGYGSFSQMFFTNVFFTNANRAVQRAWPKLQVNVVQTTYTLEHGGIHLTLVAAPAPRFLSALPDAQTGSVRLQWQAYDVVQLERATAVSGPYSTVEINLTSQSFVDVGALTNQTQLYYRLRQQ